MNGCNIKETLIVFLILCNVKSVSKFRDLEENHIYAIIFMPDV